MDWGEEAAQRLREIAGCRGAGPGVTRFPFTAAHRAGAGGDVRRGSAPPQAPLVRGALVGARCHGCVAGAVLN